MLAKRADQQSRPKKPRKTVATDVIRSEYRQRMIGGSPAAVSAQVNVQTFDYRELATHWELFQTLRRRSLG